MKIRSIIVLLIVFAPNAFSQVELYGLDGFNVTDLRFYGTTLYASTNGNGVFRRNLLDSEWTSLGLTGKNIRAIYPHQVGLSGFAVTAGIAPDFSAGDSTLVYYWSNDEWIDADSGMNHALIQEIGSIDGMPGSDSSGILFAAGSEHVFRKTNEVWKEIQSGLTYTVIRVSPNHRVWVGGEIPAPSAYLAVSSDTGETWNSVDPGISGDNGCNSFAFNLTDSNTIYAGMEGTVTKTTNGGTVWEPTGPDNSTEYFYGLTIDPSHPDHIYAGGIPEIDAFGLYESIDGATHWIHISPSPDMYTGITSLAVNPVDGNDLFIGTLGRGVYRYHSTLLDVREDHQGISEFRLYQNYPNPFNPSTTIEYSIPKTQHVSLAVFDMIGREIARLVDGEMTAGRHTAEWKSVRIPSGMYFYRLQTEGGSATKKLILLK